MSNKALPCCSGTYSGSTEMLAMMHPWGIRVTTTNTQRSYADGVTPAPQVIGLYPMPMMPARDVTVPKPSSRKRSSEDSPTPPPSATSTQHASGCSSIPSKRPERMKDWLMRQIESKEHPGLEWVNKEAGIFCIPWRHAKHRDYDPTTDASIFRAWAMQSKRYHGEGDQASWKANFRSAICSLPDVQELPDRRTDRYRVFQIISEIKKPRDHDSCSHPKRPRYYDGQNEAVPLLSPPPSLSSNGGPITSTVSGLPVVLIPQAHILPHSPHLVRSPSVERSSTRSITPVQVSCIRENPKPLSVSSLSSLDKNEQSHGLSTPSHTSSCSPSHASSHSPNHAYSDTEPEVDNVVENKFSPFPICNMPREDDGDENGEDDGRIESFEECDGPCHYSPSLKLNTDRCSGEAPCEKEMELLREDSTDQLQVSVPLKSNRSPQFHVAVYYNNLEPITMEAVKNKHGCYVYSGLKPDHIPGVPPESHFICLPPGQKYPSGNTFILNQLTRGMQIESTEEGDLYVTALTPLVVYVRSVSSYKGVSVKTLPLERREKVFDYAIFKELLLSSVNDRKTREVGKEYGEVPSPYVTMTIGQPMHKDHPLILNYVTIVVYLRRVIRRLEQVCNLTLPPVDSFDCVSLTSPPIEMHSSDQNRSQKPNDIMN